MRRLLYAILLGLIGAGIVHIVILILLPLFSQRDLVEACGSRRSLRHDFRRRAGGRPPSDRPIRSGGNACRSICRMARCGSRPSTVPFWSASIYDRGGQNVYFPTALPAARSTS